MKYSLFVCLIVVGMEPVVPKACAQVPALQQGIRVQMTSSNNAVPFPTADTADAWIVTVTDEGHLYFGGKPLSREGLLQQMISTPRNREAKLYLKSDARAPYATVEEALDAARHDFFQSVVLLTSRPGSPPAESMAAPGGLEVEIVSPSSPAPATVQVLSSGSGSPALKVNGQNASLSSLKNRLGDALQTRTDKLVLVRADGKTPFAEIVHVIDSCRAIGATAVLAGPEL